jgi:hypothetical protein
MTERDSSIIMCIPASSIAVFLHTLLLPPISIGLYYSYLETRSLVSRQALERAFTSILAIPLTRRGERPNESRY